jgi:hypothetical protein
MTRRLKMFAWAGAVLGSATLARAWSSMQPADPATFDAASVRFEQNATDGDVEVVYEITGSDDGLTKLTITAPDGRGIANFAAPHQATLGMRQFVFESPEPKDVAALKAAYPEGAYTLSAMAANGQLLAGRVTLTHKLPSTTTFVQPRADARDVSARDLEITWVPVSDAVAYILELEQEGTQTSLTARLPQSMTRFSVPDGFLQSGKEYQLGIGTVSTAGNISFIETSFSTAAQ